ncbi:DUF3592 domain-containing protein [Streptomyces litmocidini]|uniref:DUF3592 domain-containing protein n=1 Tax=Streptomyces litmocidini TaxID=67318 RepID=UPI0036FA2E61
MDKAQVVVGLFAVFLGVLSLGGFAAAWSSFRLRSRGHWIEADIVRVREATYSDGDSRFYPVVAFTPPGGERVEVEPPVGKACPSELARPWSRDEIRVLYDPARPQRVELEGHERDGTAMSLLVAVALAGVAVHLFREVFA